MAYAPFDLKGKVALVTGGNSGIGLGMAEALAQAGADVVVWGTNAEKNLAAEGKLNQLGVRVLVQKVDVSDEAAVIGGMQDAIDALGRLDTVIANAGIGGGAPISKAPSSPCAKPASTWSPGPVQGIRAARSWSPRRCRRSAARRATRLTPRPRGR